MGVVDGFDGDAFKQVVAAGAVIGDGIGWSAHRLMKVIESMKGTGRTQPSVPIIELMHQGFSIIGRGKAGRALATAWEAPDKLYARDGRPDGWVLLAVPDDAIEEMGRIFKGRCVHMSGSLHFPDIPCVHPLTSFDGTSQDWTGTPLALTGAVPKEVLSAFENLGFCGFELPPEKKALYHAAAVITSGHTATLWLEAARLLRDENIVLPGKGLWPLAIATLNNVEARGAEGRTGPFVRNDNSTIDRDVEALPEEWKRLFRDLGAFY